MQPGWCEAEMTWSQDDTHQTITCLIPMDCAHLRKELFNPLISLFCPHLSPYKNLCLPWEVEMSFETWVPIFQVASIWINHFPLHQQVLLEFWLSQRRAAKPAFGYKRSRLSITWPKRDFPITPYTNLYLKLAYLSFPSTLHTFLLQWFCSHNSTSPVSSAFHPAWSKLTYHGNVILSPSFRLCLPYLIIVPPPNSLSATPGRQHSPSSHLLQRYPLFAIWLIYKEK